MVQCARCVDDRYAIARRYVQCKIAPLPPPPKKREPSLLSLPLHECLRDPEDCPRRYLSKGPRSCERCARKTIPRAKKYLSEYRGY